jgi:hypothetical protein
MYKNNSLNLPVILPGAVVGLYSTVGSFVGDFDLLRDEDFLDPLPGLFESIPEC